MGSPRAADEFSVQVRANVVTVSGDIDMATAPQLREALGAAGGGADGLVVDLTTSTFLDSAGVAVLFDHVPDGLELIVQPDSIVMTVLAVTGLTEAATIRQPDGEQPQPQPHPHRQGNGA